DTKPGPNSFASKSAGWRITILSAGVVMNVALTAVLLSVQGVIGIPTAVTDDNAAQLSRQQTYIVEIAEGSPAKAAGLLPFDRIAAIDGLVQPTTRQVQEVVTQHLGEELRLLIDRQGVRHELVVLARENPPVDEGAIGVQLSGIGLITVPWWQAPWHGVVRTGQMLAAILGQFGDLARQVVTGSIGGVQFLGPVGIASYTNEVTQMGFGFVLEFAGLISLNLAIINILPIPALDGGRILFVLIEQIRGKRLPAKTEHLAHTVGFMLLLVLILFITWQDILRFV
ncbi:site-2 protease family protein, partial [Patescibacteria group bacterium]|nr:site-2 protease family protein [Patescibacteria group bacterium]